MKRFFVVTVIIMIIAVSTGCNFGKDVLNDAVSSDFSVIMPVDDSVNGYKTETESKVSEIEAQKETTASAHDSSVSFYVNVKTGKLHKTTCVYAKKGVEDGEFVSKDRNTLINEGYTPCKKCNP